MRVLFVHQNMPGQFRRLATTLAARPGAQVVFLTRRNDVELPGVLRATYDLHRAPNPDIHVYLRRAESAVLFGQAVARALMELRNRGFVPDVVVGHGGWGETLFVKDVLPDVPLLNYCEFYYRSRGADVGFDAEFPSTPDSDLRTRMRAAHLLLEVEACDRGWSPTAWQRSVHPQAFHDKITVVHEGVDTRAMAPDPAAGLTLPNGRTLRPGDEVVTYVARNLEPYRGFHTFMRALPRILRERPGAQVIVVGGEEVSYGAPPPGGGTWRQTLAAEAPIPDPSRVHFLGRVPYETFRRILAVSAVHVYLTYPFVLSWSMLEAMSCGCLVLGSRTAPVEEVVADGVNGLLVDFFDPDAVAAGVVAALATPEKFAPLRAAARRTVIERYEAADCLKGQLDMVGGLLGIEIR